MHNRQRINATVKGRRLMVAFPFEKAINIFHDFERASNRITEVQIDRGSIDF